MDTGLTEKLAEICERHVCNSNDVPESYVPHIPDNWNGVLIVAEAQNLSQKNKDNRVYRQKLVDALHEERIRRLQVLRPDSGGIGVQPWDDGLLPLAVAAALKVDPEGVAVSNAVPWSLTTPTGANAKPTPHLQEMATRFWQDLLASMRPSQIVAAGAVARKVMKSADAKPTIWGSPSPRVLSVLTDSVNLEELKLRFGARVEAVLQRWNAERVLERHPEWKKGGTNRVLYAYLAVWKSDAKAGSSETAA